jgi:hypothetical protein
MGGLRRFEFSLVACQMMYQFNDTIVAHLADIAHNTRLYTACGHYVKRHRGYDRRLLQNRYLCMAMLAATTTSAATLYVSTPVPGLFAPTQLFRVLAP